MSSKATLYLIPIVYDSTRVKQTLNYLSVLVLCGHYQRRAAVLRSYKE